MDVPLLSSNNNNLGVANSVSSTTTRTTTASSFDGIIINKKKKGKNVDNNNNRLLFNKTNFGGDIRPKILLETLSKRKVNCLFLTLYFALAVSCSMCIFEIYSVNEVTLGHSNACNKTTINPSIIYTHEFTGINSWYSLSLRGMYNSNMSSIINNDNDNYKFNNLTAFKYNFKFEAFTRYGKNENLIKIEEDVDYTRTQKVQNCDKKGVCDEELISQSAPMFSRECNDVDLKTTGKQIKSMDCVDKITFTIIDGGPFCNIVLHGSYTQLPLASVNFIVCIFSSTITLFVWMYWLYIFTCNKQCNMIRRCYCSCCFNFHNGISHLQQENNPLKMVYERVWLTFLFPAMLIFQLPEHTVYPTYHENYYYSNYTSSIDTFIDTFDAIRRPFGLSCILLFWLCFIDLGSEISKKRLSVCFYFPKVIVSSCIWVTLTIYVYGHNTNNLIPLNKYEIKYSMFICIAFFILYLIFISFACHRTTVALEKAPYHTIRKEHMVFRFIALCSFALVFYVPSVLVIAYIMSQKKHYKFNSSDLDSEDDMSIFWKLTQRMAFGYPTVILISLYTWMLAYIYLLPGIADPRRKWVAREITGQCRRRSKFMFDNVNSLMESPLTSSKEKRKGLRHHIDIQKDTKVVVNDKIIQQHEMSFSSFCFETALELLEASHLSYYDIPFIEDCGGVIEEKSNNENTSDVGCGRGRNYNNKDTTNTRNLTNGSFGFYGRKERERLDSTRYKIKGSVYDEETNCYAIIFIRDDRIVISFRGTSNLTHWRQNCQCFNQQSIDWFDIDEMIRREGLDKFLFPPTVHSGFKEMYLNVRVELFKILEDIIKKDQRNKSNLKYIFLTGHSLGGALATMASLEIRSKISHKYQVIVYTFGSPRIGNHSLSDLMLSVVPNIFRVVTQGDMIPQYPKLYILGNTYKHTGIQVFFDYSKAIIMEPNFAESAISNILFFQKTRPRFHKLLYYKLCLLTFLSQCTDEKINDSTFHHLLYENDDELIELEEEEWGWGELRRNQ